MGEITDIFNPTGPVKDFKASNFNTAGLSSEVDKRGNVTLNRSAELNNTLSSLSNVFLNQANDLSGLRGQVTPGLSRLTTEAVSALNARRGSITDQLNNVRRKTIGDLRDNLSRRRIAGSSFAADAVARNEAEFLQQQKDIESHFGTLEADFKQKAFLQEVDISNRLIQEEAQARQNQFQTYLNQYNFEANLAAQLSSTNSQLNAANAQVLSQLNVDLLKAAGKGAGSLIPTAGAGQAAGATT